MQTSGTPVGPKRSLVRRAATRLAQIAVGLAVGLGLAELGFRMRDDGAFPHVNVYLPDAELGVRLEPGAEQRLRVGDNAVTSIRINSLGFRGAEPGPPTEEEIVVVGDSQAFGLGVEEDETFSHALAALTHRPVFDAGVPTYGPLEYAKVAESLLSSRRAKTLVYVVNVANDLFEHARPNMERHAVWDGWAVRVETKPRHVAEFPGRRWLMSRSHLVFAARRAWHLATVEADDEGFDSEGGITDLVHAGQAAVTQHDASREHVVRVERERRERLARLAEEIREEETYLGDALRRLSWAIAERSDDYDAGDRNSLAISAYVRHPGDIVEIDDGESSRGVAVTAEMIRRGAELRKRLAPRLATLRVGGSLGYPYDEQEVEQLNRARQALDRSAVLVAERDRLTAEAPPEDFVPSVLEQRLVEVSELCKRHGAELVVLVLPLDVQVSPSEWAKYGAEPVDMSGTEILVRDAIETARRLGARAVDATAALRAAPAPVFLRRDIHLTANGHSAVAQALADALAEPAPLAMPRPGLPDGRTYLPDRDAWLRTPENTVTGSSAAGCETIQIAEWLRVRCTPKRRVRPTGAEVLEGGEGEARVVTTEEATTLLVPLVPGHPFRARFYFTDRTQDLVVAWPAEGAPTMAFEAPSGPGRPLAVTERDARLCACWSETMREQTCDEYGDRCTPSCANAYGDASEACAAAYPDDCARFVACARGEVESPPRCAAGEIPASPLRQCVRLCNDDVPCPEGTSCTPWHGTAICR